MNREVFDVVAAAVTKNKKMAEAIWKICEEGMSKAEAKKLYGTTDLYHQTRMIGAINKALCNENVMQALESCNNEFRGLKPFSVMTACCDEARYLANKNQENRPYAVIYSFLNYFAMPIEIALNRGANIVATYYPQAVHVKQKCVNCDNEKLLLSHNTGSSRLTCYPCGEKTPVDRSYRRLILGHHIDMLPIERRGESFDCLLNNKPIDAVAFSPRFEIKKGSKAQ